MLSNLKCVYRTLLFSIAFLLSFNSFSQKDIDIDGLLRSRINILPSSYFIIRANTLLETYTLAPQIIEQTDRIKASQPCKYFVYLFKDGAGIGEKNLARYTEENFGIKENKYVHVLIADSIFEALGHCPNSEVIYVYNKKLFKRWDGKYDIHPQSPLPYDILDIQYDSSYTLPDTSYMHSNQSIFFAINDSFAIEVFDSHSSRVRLISLPDGVVMKVFQENRAGIHDKLFKYLIDIGYDTSNFYSGINYLNSIKRSSIKIVSAHVVNPNEIYLIGDVSFLERLSKPLKIPGEYNNEGTINFDPGSLSQVSVGFVIQTNKEFEVIDVALFDELSKTKYNKNSFVDPGTMFFTSVGRFYTFVYNYNEKRDVTYDKFYKRNKHTRFVHEFTAGEGMITFKKRMPPVLAHPFSEFYFCFDVFHSIKLGKKTYIISSIFPEVYDLNEEEVVDTIPNTQTTDFYCPVNNYDTNAMHIPFYLMAVRSIMKGKYALLFYKTNESLYIDVVGEGFTVIQHEEITDILPIKEKVLDDLYYYSQSFFTDNYLYISYCEGGVCKFYRFFLSPRIYH